MQRTWLLAPLIALPVLTAGCGGTDVPPPASTEPASTVSVSPRLVTYDAERRNVRVSRGEQFAISVPGTWRITQAPSPGIVNVVVRTTTRGQDRTVYRAIAPGTTSVTMTRADDTRTVRFLVRVRA